MRRTRLIVEAESKDGADEEAVLGVMIQAVMQTAEKFTANTRGLVVLRVIVEGQGG